jgi:hypothetical protein
MSKVSFMYGVSLSLGLVVAGASVDRFLLNGSPPNVTAKSSAGAIAPAPVQATPGPGTEIAQVRAVIREELASALRTTHQSGSASVANASGASASGAAERPAVTPERQQEAWQTANALISSGQWGEIERIRFHQSLLFLPPAQAHDVMLRAQHAVADGSLSVQTQGPPL